MKPDAYLQPISSQTRQRLCLRHTPVPHGHSDHLIRRPFASWYNGTWTVLEAFILLKRMRGRLSTTNQANMSLD